MIGGLGVFTHPEWKRRGKRSRLRLFLYYGKVLPEDATNLRIIHCDVQFMGFSCTEICRRFFPVLASWKLPSCFQHHKIRSALF